MNENKLIIYFDSDCLYCNRFVIFILDNDKNNEFYFSTVSLDISEILVGRQVDSIILKDSDKIYLYSKAILKILKELGGKYYILACVFGFIPTSIADFCYRQFAKIRKNLPYGSNCRLLTPQEKERFLS